MVSGMGFARFISPKLRLTWVFKRVPRLGNGTVGQAEQLAMIKGAVAGKGGKTDYPPVI